MPTYKGKPVSAAKARFLIRKGKKLDAPKQPAPAPKPVLADKPRTVTPRATTARPAPVVRPPAAPLGGTPQSFDISDAELEKLTAPAETKPAPTATATVRQNEPAKSLTLDTKPGK